MTKSNDDRSATLGIDPGAGAIKIFGAAGGIQLPSIVSVDGGRTLSRMAGLTQAKPPLHVRTRAGSFWLGSRAILAHATTLTQSHLIFTRCRR
jgi:hypothetical protein